MFLNPFSDITFELRCRRSLAELRAHLEAQPGLVGNERDVAERAPGAQKYVLSFTDTGFIAQERHVGTAARRGFTSLIRARFDTRPDGTDVTVTVVAMRVQIAAFGALLLWMAFSLALQHPSSKISTIFAIAMVASSALIAAHTWARTRTQIRVALSELLQAEDDPNEPPPTF